MMLKQNCKKDKPVSSCSSIVKYILSIFIINIHLQYSFFFQFFTYPAVKETIHQVEVIVNAMYLYSGGISGLIH